MLAGACTRDNPAYHEGVRDAGSQDLVGHIDLGPDLQGNDGALDVPRGSTDAPFEAALSDATADAVWGAPDGDPAVDSGAPDATEVGPAVEGLVLHWRLDETSGMVAKDSSGNGFDGTYTGSPAPAHTAESAPTDFANPGSRQFSASVNQSVQLGTTPSALQPTAELSVTLWFRTRLTGRADFITHGGDYFLRIMSGEIEFVRRRPPGSSPDIYITATGSAPGAADGQWHHVAGVATTNRIAIYLDGSLIGRRDELVPFAYAARTLTLGRSATGAPPFEGWLDDVRIYDRAVNEVEIQALAAGAP